jgi:hypothetical protein
MQERVPGKPAPQSGFFAELCYTDNMCACSCGGISQGTDSPGPTRSARLPNDEAVVLPVTMFNDRPFGPVFVPQ